MALSNEGLRYLTSSYILPQVAFPAAAFSLPPLRGVTFTGVRSPPTQQRVTRTMIYVTSPIWTGISEVQAIDAVYERLGLMLYWQLQQASSSAHNAIFSS